MKGDKNYLPEKKKKKKKKKKKLTKESKNNFKIDIKEILVG